MGPKVLQFLPHLTNRNHAPRLARTVTSCKCYLLTAPYWQGMCSPSFKGKMQRVEHPLTVKLAISDEKRQIHQILHPAIRRVSRKRVGVNLLGELLFPRDDQHTRLLDSCKPEPVMALDGFERLYHYI